MILKGRCSEFGGSKDETMSNDDGLAFYEHAEADRYPDLFFPRGEFRWTWERLRTDRFFIALNIPLGANRAWAQESVWKITNPENKRSVFAKLVDRGPGAKNRVVDCSNGLLNEIQAKTDDILLIEEVMI